MTTLTRSGRIHSLESHPQPQSQGKHRLRLLCADWLLSFRCSAEVLCQALVDANTGARPLPDHPLREGDLVRLYLADAHEHPCDEERTSAKRTPAS